MLTKRSLISLFLMIPVVAQADEPNGGTLIMIGSVSAWLILAQLLFVRFNRNQRRKKEITEVIDSE